MGYILDLRKKIGKDTIIMTCASVIVVDKKNRVLLQLRSDNHLWAYHGGALEIDEEISACAARELKEETGLDALSLELFKICSGKDMHYTYPNGDEVSIVDVVYICRDYKGELKPQKEEVLDLKFFAYEELPKTMMHNNLEVLKEFYKLQGDQK